MDFLRNIASAALQSTGVTFPFIIGDRVQGIPSSSIWDVREGVKKDDSTPITLFVFDLTLPPIQPGNRDRRALLPIARNALRKLRSIRHPNILRYIDSLETDTHIYIATEPVLPLAHVLSQWQSDQILSGPGKQKGQAQWLAWGIQSLSLGLAFINAPPLEQHHCLVSANCVWVTRALEWRLGGFEVLTGKGEGEGVLWASGGVVGKDVGEVSSPEVRKGGWGVLRDADPALTDTYLLALLLYSLYNPHLPLPNLSTPPSLANIGQLPPTLFPIYKRMLNPNPRTRLGTTQFVPEVQKTAFWRDNDLIDLVAALESFELAGESEKLSLLRRIRDSSDNLPPPFLSAKILPSLLHSLSLPAAPASAILPLVLSIGKDVPANRYNHLVLDPVVRLYASPDRGTRMALLEGLTEYGERLERAMVVDKVWPHLITGFADTVAVIREATVKAIPIIAPKLNDRLLNNDLLRLLAKMQVDPEPSIRTNTCILLGRLAPLLGPNTKKKVLVPAFARSLKDGFVHARVAGLMALMATEEFYDREDLAGRVIPNMAFTMIDKEKLVRDQAFKAMQMFMKRLETAAASMPETVLMENPSMGLHAGLSTTTQASAAQGGGGNGLVGTAAGAAGALAGWALSSLNKQIPPSEMRSNLSYTPGQLRNSVGPSGQGSGSSETMLAPSTFSSPRPSFGETERTTTTTTTTSGRPLPTKPSSVNGNRAGGMQLGSSSRAKPRVQESSTLVNSLVAEIEDEFGSVGDAWGDGDLMDVNADADDWSAFETAPTPMEVPVPVTQSRTKPPSTRSVIPPNDPLDTHDGWDDLEFDMAPPVVEASKIVKAKTPVAKPEKAPIPSRAKPAEEPRRSPSPAFIATRTAAPTMNLAAMSKEEKEQEMARRREERKAKIAAMKASRAG